MVYETTGPVYAAVGVLCSATSGTSAYGGTSLAVSSMTIIGDAGSNSTVLVLDMEMTMLRIILFDSQG